MARIDIIKPEDLGDYFLFERLRTELYHYLTRMNELSEQRLAIAKKLPPICAKLDRLHKKHKLKLPDDLAKAVRQNRGY